ncbi:MAG: EAL domain-containing protein [Anaerolineaceae bacterium]|nr:EAL domain-containing protein [Anaerolineaceae bacterium]
MSRLLTATRSNAHLTSLSLPKILLRIGLLAALGLLAANAALLWTARTVWQRTLINDAAAAISTLLGFIGLAYGAYWSKRLSSRSRSAWLLLALSSLFAFTGNVIYFILEVILRRPASPSLADLFYLAMYPISLLGVILLPTDHISLKDLSRFGLDITIIVLSSTFMLWEIIIEPLAHTSAASFIAISVAIAYPVADLVVIWALLKAFLRPHSSQPTQPVWLLLAAGMFLMIADCLSTGPQVSTFFPSSGWINLLYLIVPLLFLYSGLLQAVQVTSAPQVVNSSYPNKLSQVLPDIQLVLPYLWLAAALLVLLLDRFSQYTQHPALFLTWASLIFISAITRQIVALLDNRRLTGALQQVNQELQKRIEALASANRQLSLEMNERQCVELALREREETLTYNTLHDVLTDLPNRKLLMEHLNRNIRRLACDNNYHFALLFLDFDGFKVVNDSLGHLTGDELLIAIGQRLRSSVREVDVVARLGGDEFVVLVEDVTGSAGVFRAAERLQEKLSRPFEVAGRRIFITASIGVVPGDKRYQQPDEILRDADVAMYEAKAQGKARSMLFTPNMHTQALDRLVIESDLRSALERGEFRLLYQPILELESNHFTGFEALIRWQHPERGLLNPLVFIPTAEISGLIVPITRWALGQACRQMRDWQIEIPGGLGLTISVNLSPKLFSQSELQGMVELALDESGLLSTSLMLEITEGAILEETEETRKILNTWRSMGIQVHMDDFGTGYSSLSYLHRFPIDALKIDRAFISRINSGGEHGEIVRTIIALARELNISVIAEGIETNEQLDFLKKLGCQYGQGYFISLPLEPDNVLEFLEKQFVYAR